MNTITYNVELKCQIDIQEKLINLLKEQPNIVNNIIQNVLQPSGGSSSTYSSDEKGIRKYLFHMSNGMGNEYPRLYTAFLSSSKAAANSFVFIAIVSPKSRKSEIEARFNSVSIF